MNKIWFTSDLHFGHDKEFLYGPRGFKTIGEHDRMIIANWNEIVAPDDEVYILGDLMLGSDEYGINCLSHLNGKLHIIFGNHDESHRRRLYFLELENASYPIAFAEKLKYQKYEFFLSHYPTLVHPELDNKKIWNLHGHTHSKNKFSEYPHCYNVALDAHDNRPVSIDEIIEDIRNFNNNNINKEEN